MDDLGTELPQRRAPVLFLVGSAAVLAVPTVRALAGATDESGGAAVAAWAMSLLMLAVLVALPLALARSLHLRRTFVSDEAVTVVTGGGRAQRSAYAQLTEIRVRVSGQGGALLRGEKVFLLGPGATGGPSTLLVSRLHVETLQPLLTRLATEVGHRPELLRSDLERDYFHRALATAP